MVSQKRFKANVRVKKEAEVSLPPSVHVTKVVVSHRMEDGKFVYDLTGPDGMTITHRPKPVDLTGGKPVTFS